MDADFVICTRFVNNFLFYWKNYFNFKLAESFNTEMVYIMIFIENICRKSFHKMSFVF